MTYLRSTYAAGDHPHATCVTFFFLPPVFSHLPPALPFVFLSSTSSESERFLRHPGLGPLPPFCGLRIKAATGFMSRPDFTNGRYPSTFPVRRARLPLPRLQKNCREERRMPKNVSYNFMQNETLHKDLYLKSAGEKKKRKKSIKHRISRSTFKRDVLILSLNYLYEFNYRVFLHTL